MLTFAQRLACSSFSFCCFSSTAFCCAASSANCCAFAASAVAACFCCSLSCNTTPAAFRTLPVPSQPHSEIWDHRGCF